MALAIRPLKELSNEVILNAIRRDASTDYQRRIPEATKANLQETMQNLADNRPEFNEFLGAIVNKIGLSIGRNMIWQNPWSIFKMGMLPQGDTIEEYGMGLLQAHSYDTDREALEREIFGTELPEVQVSYHKINREDYYKVTVNENLLLRAVLVPGGLSDFTTKLMQAPTTSDQWDEFSLMCQLFAEYEKNDGFYKVNVSDVVTLESDADAAKDAIRKIRTYTGELQYPNAAYNAAGLPTFANPDELVLFATPAFQAAVDVEALAGAFNPDKLATPKIFTVPEHKMAITGAQAILTTKDFFMVADTVIQTESIRNPAKMHTNFFLHHHSIISASRFVPAILFTTEAGTDYTAPVTVVESVTAIKVTNRDNVTVTDVKRGEIYNVLASAVTAPAGGFNDGVRWEVAGATAPRTHVTQDGVLHVAGTEGAATLKLTATATWVDDMQITRAGKSSTATVTVSGPVGVDWPLVAEGAGAMSMRKMVEIESDERGDVAPDYSGMTNAELIEILASRDLDTTGVKTVLIDRLTADDAAKADA